MLSPMHASLLREVEGIIASDRAPVRASLILTDDARLLVELETLDAAEISWDEIRRVSAAIQKLDGVSGVVLTIGRRAGN